MLNTLGYTIRNNRLACVFPFSVIGRGQPSVLLEVMAEETICRENQGIGNLLDGHVAGAKHGFSLNDYMLADMFHRQFAGCESDEFREVFWADAEPVRIELDSAFPVGIELEIVFETQEYFFLPGQALGGLCAGAYHESYRENCTKIAAFEPFLSLQSLSSRFNDRAAVDVIATAK